MIRMNQNMNWKKKVFLITFLLSSLFVFSYNNFLWTLVQNPETKVVNYFLDSSAYLTDNLIVNTSSCRIPYISPFHPSIMHFIKPPLTYDCERTYGRLTFVNKTNLIFNLTALANWGYSFNSISCCYKTVSRIQQSLHHYDETADSNSVLSQECQTLPQIVNPIKVEFIKVMCYKIYLNLFYDVIYTNFHTLSQPKKNEAVQGKINYWTSQANLKLKNETWKSSTKTPPNVILIGLDSVSRMSSQRNLEKTLKYLKEIGGIEMSGYTKVGENTWPNAVPFMSGYSTTELSKICLPSPWTAQDDCPYLWKRFSKANYLTGHLEDAPIMAIHNYFKTGFVNPPSDYYLRPLMEQIYEEKNFLIFGSYQHYTLHCAGPDRPYEKIGSYMLDLVDMAREMKTPILIYSWQTSMAHDGLNELKGADEYLENLLKRLQLTDDESNSIVFLFSDHGYRFGAFRETHLGWLEDKLPFMHIYLPKKTRQDHPEWIQSLKINSRRLSSPYDLYHTWSHILNEYTSTPPTPDFTTKDNETIPRIFGQSLFRPVAENRTCAQAGILSSFCACHNPLKVSLDNPKVLKAAKAAVSHINKMLPNECHELQLDQVTAGAIDQAKEMAESVVIVGFSVNPGQFRFEATVNLIERNQTFYLDADVLRTNSINKRQVKCVKDGVLERYCYCSSFMPG